jgi:tetratricopeptide (TPR) repeat protein
MPHLTRLWIALAVAACATPPAGIRFDLAPGTHRVQWQRSLADATALAEATGRPLLLALNMDGESASDRIWRELYRDREFVALTRRCVCVGASVFRHQPVDHDAEGRRVECPRFPGMTCGEHMACEPELFAKHFKDGDRVAPRHALVQPDGSVAFDLSLCFDLDDVTRALAKATEGVTPWTAPAATTWDALAARRDAAGRRAFEREFADATERRSLGEALESLVGHGDAGALEALRLGVEHGPDASLVPLRTTAGHLGLAAPFAALLRERAQRLGCTPGDTAPPADWRELVAGCATPDADAATKTWLSALAATAPAMDTVAWADLHLAWPGLTSPDRGTDRIRVDMVNLGHRMPALVDLEALRTAAARVRLATPDLPRPGFTKREPAPADELRQRLTDLDAELARQSDDDGLLAAAGAASLDLGRREAEAGSANTTLLLEDALRYLDRALARQPDRFEAWLDRARAAWMLGRRSAQQESGERMLALAGFAWPPTPDRHEALLQNAQAVEGLRWIGDAQVQALTADDLRTPVPAIEAIRGALWGLGLPAVSPFGDAKDWTAFTSFVGSLGLRREELALLLVAVDRLPAAADLRQALYGALWRAGRPELAPPLADDVVRLHPDSADAWWWAGHARMLLAEDLRRRESWAAALATYAAAVAPFRAAEVREFRYAESVRQYLALAAMGSAMTILQRDLPRRSEAAEHLRRAIALQPQLATLRDGLGYDVLDTIDRLLEWRAGSPSDVTGPELLQSLDELQVTADAFWATAIGDALLREALRADGRNPARVLRDSVDAGGKALRTEVGLPTPLGDRYLADAVAATTQAVARANANDETRWLHAQVLTIRAERELERGRSQGVAADLRAAAATLGLPLAREPRDDDGLDGLRAAAAPLRERLGPARPRQRDGR